jgi:prephenate dehydrogenase
MAQFRAVTIVGLGLIGGSLGLAIRRRRLAREVIGVGRRAATLTEARRRGAIDWGTRRLAEAARQSDLVVLATPVGVMPALAARLARCVPSGCIVTDVGSAKVAVVSALERGLDGVARVVGAHPMAGSEQSGIAHAEEALFEGARCFVTRTPRTDLRALRAVTALWRRLGSHVEVLTPQRHDRLVASISHLPHLAAVCATLAAEPPALPYAAGGFRDVTRIAASEPGMWADICVANRPWLGRSLQRFQRHLSQLARAVADGDRRALLAQFRRAQRERVRL